MWTHELACATVSAAIGQDIPFEVLSYRPWLLSRQVAKEYRRGNIFLYAPSTYSDFMVRSDIYLGSATQHIRFHQQVV